MTDAYHIHDLADYAAQRSSTRGWGTLIAAALILAALLSVPHVLSFEAGTTEQVQQPQNGSIEFDGRGKWTGYM